MKQQVKEQTRFIHLSSKNISLKEKTFFPKIPPFRISGENASIKRICMTDTFEHALSSFPYKNDVIHDLHRNTPVYLAIYSLDPASIPSRFLKKPEEIQSMVGDAEENQEHWILTLFTATPQLIRLKELNFERKCKYTYDYSGKVTKLVYEKDTESYERIEKATFYHNKLFKRFQKTCLRNGIDIQEVTVKQDNMEYFGCVSSSRVYTIRHVTYRIPAGVSAQSVWAIIQQELDKNRRNYLIFDQNDFA